MRIAMLTPHCARNYGGVLQAYALQTVLGQLGHEPTIVNLVPKSRRSRSVLPSPWWGWKRCILNTLTLLRYSQSKRRLQHFAEFSNNFFHLTSKEYHIFDEIQESLPRFDAYVCGSDQLWRPGMHSLDTIRAYCLDFVKQKDAKKIAYAPSFGISSLPEPFKKIISPLINDIPYLSVREKTGQTIIRELTGRDAQIVLDPSLLLRADDWSCIAEPPRFKPPYILAYCQSQRRNFYELVHSIKKRLNLPVVVISLVPFNRIPGADHVIYDASIQEYVGLIADASCVCTNSFHGVAFSLVYKRPFWTVPHESANSRLADLLDRIGLSDRQVTTPERFPSEPLAIDYSKAGNLLDETRSESIDFLKGVLAER